MHEREGIVPRGRAALLRLLGEPGEQGRREMKALVGVVAGARMALFVVACSAHKSAAPAPQTVAGGPPPVAMGTSQHDQIEEFARQIAEARTKMGMSQEPATVAPCPNGQ